MAKLESPNPDLENGIHGLLVINEPDSWMVSRMTKTAKHLVDPGPTFNCRMPIFAKSDEIHSVEDVERLSVQPPVRREAIAKPEGVKMEEVRP